MGKLTETQCRNAKPKDKAYKLFDGGGLYLEVGPKGSRLWRLKYYYLGKEKKLALGPYSFVSERRIAQEVGCSQVSVNNAFKWLEAEGYIKRIDDRKANKVGRYVILIRDDRSHENYHPDKTHESNRADKFHESHQTERSHKNNPKRINGTEGEVNKNGPSRCGSRRKAAAPSRGPVDVSKAMNYLTRS